MARADFDFCLGSTQFVIEETQLLPYLYLLVSDDLLQIFVHSFGADA